MMHSEMQLPVGAFIIAHKETLNRPIAKSNDVITDNKNIHLLNNEILLVKYLWSRNFTSKLK